MKTVEQLTELFDGLDDFQIDVYRNPVHGYGSVSVYAPIQTQGRAPYGFFSFSSGDWVDATTFRTAKRFSRLMKDYYLTT
jgi:hypothetical protein